MNCYLEILVEWLHILVLYLWLLHFYVLYFDLYLKWLDSLVRFLASFHLSCHFLMFMLMSRFPLLGCSQKLFILPSSLPPSVPPFLPFIQHSLLSLIHSYLFLWDNDRAFTDHFLNILLKIYIYILHLLCFIFKWIMTYSTK